MAAPLLLAAAAVQGAGLLSEYRAESETSKVNESLAVRNAQIARQQGIEMERRQRVFGRQAIGDIKAGYSASGVTLEGSALDVLEFSAATAELDALTIRYESEMKAQGFMFEAAQERQKRKHAKRQLPFDMVTAGLNVFNSSGKGS